MIYTLISALIMLHLWNVVISAGLAYISGWKLGQPDNFVLCVKLLLVKRKSFHCTEEVAESKKTLGKLTFSGLIFKSQILNLMHPRKTRSQKNHYNSNRMHQFETPSFQHCIFRFTGRNQPLPAGLHLNIS